jgi:hypothetical protein
LRLLASNPAGLAGLKNPQLELLGAASIVAAVDRMTVFKSAKSWVACGSTVGRRMVPVKIIALRAAQEREYIAGVLV